MRFLTRMSRTHLGARPRPLHFSAPLGFLYFETTFARPSFALLILGAVLDFFLMDDAWVLRCCEETGLDPNLMMSARAALPGGQQMHWT